MKYVFTLTKNNETKTKDDAAVFSTQHVRIQEELTTYQTVKLCALFTTFRQDVNKIRQKTYQFEQYSVSLTSSSIF